MNKSENVMGANNSKYLPIVIVAIVLLILNVSFLVILLKYNVVVGDRLSNNNHLCNDGWEANLQSGGAFDGYHISAFRYAPIFSSRYLKIRRIVETKTFDETNREARDKEWNDFYEAYNCKAYRK